MTLRAIPSRLHEIANASFDFQVERRALLKGAGSLLGTSALNSNLLFATSSGGDPAGSNDLDTRTIGFMLPHEQFPVPKLVKLGEMAERAGFDLLATSDHLQALARE